MADKCFEFKGETAQNKSNIYMYLIATSFEWMVIGNVFRSWKFPLIYWTASLMYHLILLGNLEAWMK